MLKPFAPTSQMIRTVYAAGSATPTPIRICGSSPIDSESSSIMVPMSSGSVTRETSTESTRAARNRFSGEAGAHPSSGGSICAPARGAPAGEPGPSGAPEAEPGPGWCIGDWVTIN